MAGWQIAFQLLGIGWFIALSIIGGFGVGLWLDGKTGTRPLFTLLGGLLGIIVAFYGMFKLLLPLLRGKDSKEQ
jgi:hypothetical protein